MRDPLAAAFSCKDLEARIAGRPDDLMQRRYYQRAHLPGEVEAGFWEDLRVRIGWMSLATRLSRGILVEQSPFALSQSGFRFFFGCKI